MKTVAKLCCIAVLLCCSTMLFAQTPAAAKERAKLQFLVGKFTTETSMPASPMMPKGGTGKGTLSAEWALDSMFIVMDDKNENSVFGHFDQHGVLGYDAPTGQFVLSMFNNFGDHPVYKGGFTGDTLELNTTIPMPGRSFDQRVRLYKEGNTVKLQVLNDMGKGLAPVMEQTATPIR